METPEQRMARAVGEELDRRSSRNFWKWLVVLLAAGIGYAVLSSVQHANDKEKMEQHFRQMGDDGARALERIGK